MRWIAEAVWLVAAVIAYQTFGPVVEFHRMAPVLPMVLVVRVALAEGAIPGNIVGFLNGFLLDAFSLDWFGATMLVDSVIGYSVGAIRNRIVVDNALVRTGVLFVAAEAHSIGLVLVRSVAGRVGPEPFLVALGSGAYTAAVGGLWWALIGLLGAVLGWRSAWHAER